MPYSPAATWYGSYDIASGDTISEQYLDQYIMSNILFLKTPTLSRLANQSSTTTTSASFVDITGASISITTNAAYALVGFGGTLANSSSATVDLTITVDGTSIGDATRGIQTAVTTAASVTNFPVGGVFLVNTLTAASHTFKLQWKTNAGTLSLQAGWYMWVMEQ